MASTWFRKLKAGLVKSEITNYVGGRGELFFNTETGEFRLSDGVTPGGVATPAATLLNSLRGVNDINFNGLAEGRVLTYSSFDDNFVWADRTELTPKFTKYIDGLEYTVLRAEHGIPNPTVVNVYNPLGDEVSVQVNQVAGDITLLSNVLLDGHIVSIA